MSDHATANSGPRPPGVLPDHHAAPPEHARAARPGVALLSARERDLVTLIVQCRTNAQIAEQLFIG